MPIKPLDHFEIAKEVHKKHQTLKQETFRRYLEKGGMKYRKAMYLVSVVARQEQLGYSDAEVRELMRALGWTKVSVILAGITRKRSVKNLIRQYSNVTVPAVKNDFPSLNPRTDSSPGIVFAVQMSQPNYNRLIRKLKKLGMNQSGEKRVGVSEAFAELIKNL